MDRLNPRVLYLLDYLMAHASSPIGTKKKKIVALLHTIRYILRNIIFFFHTQSPNDARIYTVVQGINSTF